MLIEQTPPLELFWKCEFDVLRSVGQTDVTDQCADVFKNSHVLSIQAHEGTRIKNQALRDNSELHSI